MSNVLFIEVHCSIITQCSFLPPKRNVVSQSTMVCIMPWERLWWWRVCSAHATTSVPTTPTSSSVRLHVSSFWPHTDLPYVLNKSSVIMYADDSTMYSTASTCSELNYLLKIEIKAIADWVNNNKLVLNIAKRKAMVFGSRHMLSSNPQLSLTLAGQVNKTKLLGIVLDSGLQWTKQIDSIVTKMGRSIAVTRKCTKYVTPTTLKSFSLWCCHILSTVRSYGHQQQKHTYRNYK